MDDLDLYGDLDDCNSCDVSIGSQVGGHVLGAVADGKKGPVSGDSYLTEIAILQDSHERLAKENEAMKAELKNTQDQLARMVKVNKILKVNVSSLYKTARAELDRKNDRISELTRQLDNLIFRRKA